MASLKDILSGGLGAFADYYGSQQGIESARNIGTTAQQLASQLGQQVREDSKFRPFAISTASGGASTTPDGGFNANLSPEMEAARQQLMGSGLGMLGNVGNIQGAQQDIYSQLRAARQPDIERARLGLEERLFNQGRSGVRTSMFGGTPEQLAMEKAIQEQGSRDFFTARNQAVGEDAQRATIGTNMFNSSFLPEQRMFEALQVATPFSELSNRAQQQGIVTQAELERAGISGLLQGETIASNLQQQQLQALANVLSGRQSDGTSGDGLIDWGLDQLGGLFSGMFGGN